MKWSEEIGFSRTNFVREQFIGRWIPDKKFQGRLTEEHLARLGSVRDPGPPIPLRRLTSNSVLSLCRQEMLSAYRLWYYPAFPLYPVNHFMFVHFQSWTLNQRLCMHVAHWAGHYEHWTLVCVSLEDFLFHRLRCFHHSKEWLPIYS